MSTHGGLHYWLSLLLQPLCIRAVHGGQIPGRARHDANEVLLFAIRLDIQED